MNSVPPKGWQNSKPLNAKPVAIVPVGYPSKIPSPPQRVSKEDAVEFK